MTTQPSLPSGSTAPDHRPLRPVLSLAPTRRLRLHHGRGGADCAGPGLTALRALNARGLT